MNSSEIILYQPNNSSIQLNVRVEAEPVWLNRNQLPELFDRDAKTISKHFANAQKEELRTISIVAYFLTIAAAGKTKF
jgi:hypothetical protein